VQRLKENSKWRKITAGLIPLRNQVATDVWNHWLTESLVVSSPSVCECGHIGCCDSSPSQHASKHAASTGHPIIASFEPGEDWFFDYEKQGMIKGVELLPPHAHPKNQPASGPAGRMPANWESLLNSLPAIDFAFAVVFIASDELAFEQLQR